MGDLVNIPGTRLYEFYGRSVGSSNKMRRSGAERDRHRVLGAGFSGYPRIQGTSAYLTGGLDISSGDEAWVNDEVCGRWDG